MERDSNVVGQTRAHWSVYVVTAVVTTAVLLYAVVEQIVDTNFYVLWESTALLAGDHPYRDFYQSGWPLLTASSTVVQWLVGDRLIGEFLIHWTFLVAALVIGLHLAVRVSGSVGASLATTAIAIVILASTPTFQFPKLFFYAAGIWAAWSYMERPGVRRATMMGFVTAMAFLSRHDHGLYLGLPLVAAFGLARLAAPAPRTWGSTFREAAAYGATAALVIAPWALMVQMNEGLVEYVSSRAAWGRTWAPTESPYLALLDINPTGLVNLDGAAGGLFSYVVAQRWLLQVTLVVPIVVLAGAALEIVDRRRHRQPVRVDTWQHVLAAGIMVLVAQRLFRQDSYFVALLPLTAAFGAKLVAAPRFVRRTLTWPLPAWLRLTARAGQRLAAAAVLVITGVAAIACLQQDLFAPTEIQELAHTYRQLLISPPIDALQPAPDAYALTRDELAGSNRDRQLQIILRYVHDCTRGGDRVFVSGSTPYQVGYYVQRPIAGGHLQWHHGWRSDPAHEAQSLALIEGQSVPFAVSTHGRIPVELRAYPRIRTHFETHYQELEGFEGRLMVDTRRVPTGRFGALGLPCFA